MSDGQAPPPPSSPPPGGGYGGYGGAPPPPPPGGGDPNERPYNAPESIAYGWAVFKAEPAPLVIAALLVLGVTVVLGFLGSLVAGAIFQTSVTISPTGEVSGGGFVAGLLANVLISLIAGLVAQILVAGLIKGGLLLVDGQRATLGEMYAGWDKGKVVVAAVLVSVATSIGSLLCYVPGLVVGYLTVFTMFFVVDQDLSPVEAITASVRLTTSQLGDTLVFYVLGVLLLVAGAIVCGVGLLVTAPLVVIAGAYTFRRLHGRPVAPAPA